MLYVLSYFSLHNYTLRCHTRKFAATWLWPWYHMYPLRGPGEIRVKKCTCLCRGAATCGHRGVARAGLPHRGKAHKQLHRLVSTSQGCNSPLFKYILTDGNTALEVSV